MSSRATAHVPRFDREFFGLRRRLSPASATASSGGKARGLVLDPRRSSRRSTEPTFPGVRGRRSPGWRSSPRTSSTPSWSGTTSREIALSDLPDDRIAHAFQRADLPAEIARRPAGPGRGGPHAAGRPLVEPAGGRAVPPVRRRLRDEDDPQQPAGSRTPASASWSRRSSSSTRRPSSAARRATSAPPTGPRADEKMAVIIQEVVGPAPRRPLLPGRLGRRPVATTSIPTGHARADDGVVNLALGLGKTIVDGGICWSYSPARPKAPPPFGSAADLLEEHPDRRSGR